MGKYQGRICGDVILGKDVHDVADHGAVPRVTFTDPQVAAVGLTEAQAREQGIDVRVVSYPTGNVAGAYTRGNGIAGTSQIVVDESARTIVGATFTGPDVQEMLHAATIAIVAKVTLDTAVARRALLPHRERGLAPAAGGVRPLTLDTRGNSGYESYGGDRI